MNIAVVKALTRRIEARMGGGQNAARAAGVQASVWSCYRSDDYPNASIPFHRLLVLADAKERAAFAELLLAEPDGTPGDIKIATEELTEDAAELQRSARIAQAGGPLSNRAAREIIDEALHVREDADRVIRLAERKA